MLKNTVRKQAKEVLEQGQSVAVTAGSAAKQNTLRNIGLIIGREYKNRVTQRSFIISTIIISVLVGISAFVPTIIQYFTSTPHTSNMQTKVVVVNNAGLVAGLDDKALAHYVGTVLNGTPDQATGANAPGQQPPFAVTIQPANALGSLQEQVKHGDLLLVLDRATNQDLHFTYYTSANSTDDPNLTKVQVLAQRLNIFDTSHRLGLTPTQTSSLGAQPSFTVKVEHTQSNRSVGDTVAGYIIAYMGNLLIYMTVLLYGMGVAMGVGEEKGSRIMEILVNAATPFQLMAGKILGIGAAGLTQMACLVIVGIGAFLLQSPLQVALFGTSSGGLSLNITSVVVTLLILFLVYFILGFLLYATLFAALGALVKRQDEVQNTVQPISWLFVIGYLASFFGVSSPDALWVRVISYVPFWTPTVMLMRIGANGGVAGWEIALTIVLMMISIIVCTLLSARIYRVGILMYGQRPNLWQLVKLAVRGFS